MELFESVKTTTGPLAELLRPQALAEVQGQAHVIRALQPYLNEGRALPNLILWGPPGCGKTTLARLIATQSKMRLHSLNAIATGAKELREIGERAHEQKIQGLGGTLVFIDEIHRLNRAQQDVLLPFTESGDLTLIGATTENPSYELNSALLSRARVLVLNRLTSEDLKPIFLRACAREQVEPIALLTKEAEEALLKWADGDARKLLSAIENAVTHFRVEQRTLGPEQLSEILQSKTLLYDRQSEQHYDTISAFIKSIRGSDADAGMYYLARMLKGGEDPVFIARRLVILASEDVGNADPRAITVAVAGLQAVELVGMPEAAISLAQVVTYMSSAPKSNASYMALNEAQAEVERSGTLPIPKSLRSSKTKLSKDLGYGQGYRYAHEGPTGWQPMTFLPDEIKDKKFYHPTNHGFEKTIQEYLKWLKQKPEEKS